ncbi:MAG: RidA family protein, partial [Sandaracinobacteroides sp.]
MADHQRLNPSGLFDSGSWGFHQVQISLGTRIIHVAGQAALDIEANVVGTGHFAAQMAKCLSNIDIACAAAGIGRSDVASLRIYVVDLDPDFAPIMIGQLTGFF